MKYCKSDPETIQEMFDSIAKNYDRTNAILSFNLHRLWNKELVKRVRSKKNSHTLLDLCAGTGDIAFAYLNDLSSPCQAILVDFSTEMLACAQKKAAKLKNFLHKMEYKQADVQTLPLQDQSVDCATLAYGIRNVHHPLKCFEEVFRVLKPGGCFGILELTRPRNPILKMGHRFYLRFFLPLLGKWLTSNKNAYMYLQKSIHQFTHPEQLEKQLVQAGFTRPKRYPLLGGVATILTSEKPTLSNYSNV